MGWRWPSQNTFGMWTVLYWTQSSRTQFRVSINVWSLAGDTLNITCNFLYCNHQVHRDFGSPCTYVYTIHLIHTNNKRGTTRKYIRFLWGISPRPLILHPSEHGLANGLESTVHTSQMNPPPPDFNKKPHTFHKAPTSLKSNTPTWKIYRYGEHRVTFGEQQETCDGTETDGNVRSAGN